MKCIVLVAGYATRMYPLTLKKPKALLTIKKKYILDYILEDIAKNARIIDEFILVTNDSFYQDFITWQKTNAQKYPKKITVINDGSTCAENRLGAVSDLVKAIKQQKIKDDIFVLAGDNILDFSLKYIFDEFLNNSHSYIMYYKEPNLMNLKKTGVIEIDENNFVVSMEEKPSNPKSNYAVPPFYWIKKADINLILNMFDENQQVDAMGQIILNLCKQTKIKAIEMLGKRYDVGSKEDYYYLQKKAN